MANNDLMTRRGRSGGSLTPFTSDLGLFAPAPFLGGNPFAMMRRMMEDMDRMWAQPFNAMAPLGAAEGMTGQLWQPTIDVSESIKHWTVEADLPGVKKDDIDVQVRDHSLMISAELKEEKEQTEGEEKDQRRFHRRERRFGYFERAIPLPENVDEDNITCGFKDGVLTVTIPKADTKQSGRRIAVTDGHGATHEKKSGKGSQGEQANA